MGSEEIKIAIQKQAYQLVQENPISSKARHGTLKREELGEYLFNLMHVFSATPINLQQAADRCEELSLNTLSSYFKNKIPEEIGHDGWAREDLTHYNSDECNDRTFLLKAETQEILKYIERIIHKDPRLYIAYMGFVEYFTIAGAADFLKDLEEKCGISRAEVTAIANHEEKDRYHTQENFELIDQLKLDDALTHEMIQVVKHTHASVWKVMNSCVSIPLGPVAPGNEISTAP